MAKQVLIVDDDNMSRELLGDSLRALRHGVRLASNGMKGLKEAAARIPSRYFVDLQMREMYGLELIAKLLSKAFTCIVPILVLSANVAGLMPPDSPWADCYQGSRFLRISLVSLSRRFFLTAKELCISTAFRTSVRTTN